MLSTQLYARVLAAACFSALDFCAKRICFHWRLKSPRQLSSTHILVHHISMNSSEDPVHAHLSRVATLLAENVNNSSELKRLRTDISAEIAAAISNYSTAQVKHGYLESMLEAAANVWVGFTQLYLSPRTRLEK
jgi:hypothetical protein